MAKTALCSKRNPSIWTLIVLLHLLAIVNSNVLFPKLQDFAEFKPISASSTCGVTGSSKFCKSSTRASSVQVCEEDTCKFDCCSTCSKTKPVPTDIGSGARKNGIQNGESRNGSSNPSFSFLASSDSNMQPRIVPLINYVREGFALSLWIKQKAGNKGTIFEKTDGAAPYKVIFQLEIQNYKMWFHYRPPSGNVSVINITPLQSQTRDFQENQWHLITVSVINKDLSYYIDGDFIKAASLKGAIQDPGGVARIGQTHAGGSQFEGLMQDILMYAKSITNREAMEAFTGKLAAAYIATECRCPPTHPKILKTQPAKCVKNVEGAENSAEFRLALTTHPSQYITDGDTVTYWQSELTDTARIDIDLSYRELQNFYIIMQFYSPQPGAVKIERSRDEGATYQAWQYFADDCPRSFGMANNGPLRDPDSVNCIQYEKPLQYSSATLTFRLEQPPPQGSPVPIRPFGQGCNVLYCSNKLLEFLKASKVRFHFYNHTLVQNAKHKYFGLKRIVVAGRCECYGHSSKVTFVKGNSSQSGTCVCQCDASTFTEGIKCDRCKSLYNNKAFQRGTNSDSYPCVKCQCYEHATTCYYNKTLDPSPLSRTQGGGGVCISCQHNTADRYCHVCKENYYRKSGKSLSAQDVCTACDCVGPGIRSGKSDCTKDDSTTGVIAGQCQCKQYTQGRQCNQCKPGYYDLKSRHVTGCVTCGCDTRGTVSSNTSCHAISGQCDCKTNVQNKTCDTCKSGFYGLSVSLPTGCKQCQCDPHGTRAGTVCNSNTGKCECKVGLTGRRCDQCSDGYHTLDRNGCKSCNCSTTGSKPNLLNSCQKSNGQCYCKVYVHNIRCDGCKSGYYNLSASNPEGCSICTCDPKGTVGGSRQCELQSGNCTCKSLVIGQNCNECKKGTFNLSSSNPSGCEACNCFPKGTRDGNSKPAADLECSSNGHCFCLSNVAGKRCDSCASEYYWNPSGQGCTPCNCHNTGSVGRNCNTTGQCQCKANIGGLRCDRCLPGNYGFNSGNCQPCNCNSAGSLVTTCDDTGTCSRCKKNVQGKKCDTCKPGTVNLQQNNNYGCSGAPSEQPAPFVAVRSSRVIDVTWNPPDNPNGVILRYELYRNGTLVYNNTERAFNDTNLQPNTYYYYYIITYTESGHTRSLDDGRVYRTPEDAPEGIESPSITEIKARSAKAAWVKPNVTNGLISEYRLVSVSSRSSVEFVHCRGIILKCDVTNLRPFTTYNFTVVVCNPGGCGQSVPTVANTRPTAPDSQPAPVLTSLPGGQAMGVAWDEPPEPNGVVFRYELYMRTAPFSGGGVIKNDPNVLNPRSTTVPGLTPYTFYEFRVFSFTAQVSGQTSSNWKRQRTAEGVPSGESTMSPSASPVSSTSVRVIWSAPQTPNGVITRYIISTYNPPSHVTIAKQQQANGTDRSAVVDGLLPYRVYKFTVIACNSYNCTGHSPRAITRTGAAAPEGQGAPVASKLNSSAITLTWTQPQTPNGPLPPTYNTSRAFAAFYFPPPDVTAGVHFPGGGYYKFPASFIRAGALNDIEMYFRTQYPDGLILFLASDGSQNDMLAVELRAGKPWFIFDCQDGPTAFTISESVSFDDSKWHHLKLIRRSRVGTMTIDGKYTARGTSPGTSTSIAESTGVYIGGLPKTFTILRQDTGNARLNRFNFIGCVRTVKSQGATLDWNSALTKEGVEPPTNACPVRDKSPGVLLRGGGYIAIKAGIFTGGSIFTFMLSFRTLVKSGILMFAHGPTSYVVVELMTGSIQVKLSSSRGQAVYTSSTTGLCDGRWHRAEITGIDGVNRFVISVDGKSDVKASVPEITVTSPLYIGGIPLDNTVVLAAARRAGVIPDQSFGGCVKELLNPQTVHLGREVVAMKNADLDGCVSNSTMNASLSLGSCVAFESSVLSTQNTQQYVDNGVQPFTDYLYRVSSYHTGTSGSARSSWTSIRSGQGAPTGLSAPTAAVPLDGGRSVRVSWTRPRQPNGLITHYSILAYDVMRGGDPVKSRVSDTTSLNATIAGLWPFTLYEMRIAAFTEGGEATGPGINVTTLEAVPEGVPSPSVSRYPYMLTVFWTKPSRPNGHITRYSMALGGRMVYSGLDQRTNITGLQVYTQYALQLTACTKEGCSKGPLLNVHTGELPPQGLDIPTLEVRGNDTIHVSWDQPTVPNGVIIQYEVLLSTTDNLEDYRVFYNGSRSHLSATVTGLVTGTLYFVRVRAFTNGGGTFSNASSARTVSGIPSGIPAPVVIALDYSSLFVIIREPRNPNGIITRYELYEDGAVIPVLNSTTRDNYTATGFTPYSRHTYRVHACTIQGCNPGEQAMAYTKEIAPNGTVILTASIISATSVRANWTRVAVPNGRLFYNLMIRGRFLVKGSPVMSTEVRVVTGLSVEEAEKELVFAGLLPYNDYKFWVNASNTVSYILSNTVIGKTPQAAPDGIKAPNVTVLNSTGVYVAWQPPFLSNGLLLGYELQQKTGNMESVVYRGSRFEKLVTGLEPYTRYQYRINANTSAGAGYSNWTLVVTKEAVPGSIDAPRLDPDSTSVLLEWDKPDKENGVIIHYIIYNNGTEVRRVPGNTTRYRVTGLTPFTLYTFWVSACTRIGCSRSLDSRPTRTLESVPQGLAAPRLSSPSARKIEIRWDTPTVTNGVIVSYSIFRRKVGETNFVNITAVSALDPRVFIDTTAKPVTTYEYRVIAYTKAGGGTPSPYSNITTGEGDPEDIRAPVVTALSPYALHVKWTTPGTPNGHVIRYMVRVLETGHNFTTNSTFEYNVTGLKPFVLYSVVITACTVGDCGNSPATQLRTLSANPSGQPPPTATTTSSTSLRVAWNPPSNPNGAISRYELFRRTLQDPVNPNFTASREFVKLPLTSNIARIHDDTGLGIYSLHQYQVAVFTSQGNSTSLPSFAFRTGPEPPLAGPDINATAVNHTSVLVTFSPPVTSLLRGSVKTYTIFYEHVATAVVHRFGSVPGNVTSVVVTPLKPSTNYRVWVTLDNGAGTFKSAKVTERTKDGVPEGFGAPHLFAKSSTEIRVSWSPPTTPNGKITIYNIYANDQLRINTTADLIEVFVTNLLPYTTYSIKVEVCTVYACTKSPARSERTLPAAPTGLAAPQLTAGPNYMLVEWAAPTRPNDITVRYQLYRRKVYQCPPTPPPTSLCTYIECPLSNELCGTTCYNPSLKVCCKGALHAKDPLKQCCGTGYLRQNAADDVCCSNQFHVRRPDYQCCHGNYIRVPSDSVCCRGNSGGVVVGRGDQCCGDTPHYRNGSKVCVCSALYDRLPARKCCGGQVVASVQICCGNATRGRAYDLTPNRMCCDTQYVSPATSLCCQGPTGSVKVYNYSSAADKTSKDEKCCNRNKVSSGLNCCNVQGYNATYQTCADRSSRQQTGCGTGVICNKTQTQSAWCNRCDFDSSSLICGSIKGFYAPTSVTPTTRICATEYTKLLNQANNAGVFKFLDQGLSPHSEYQYYLVGINTVGNMSSPVTKNRTLMASPEGLAPPVAVTISATSIRITWKRPKTTNGIIREYRLTRINKQTNSRKGVYSGLNLTFVDSVGLEPFTGYKYQLEACTTECASNTSLVTIFTDQAAPSVVSAPVLQPLNWSSIRVSWSLPPKPNGIIVRYNISQVFNSTYEVHLNPNDKGFAMTLIVNNLKPYTNYTFKLVACTNIGCKASPLTSALTHEAAPTGVHAPILTARGAREVEALWYEPDVLNGIVIKYSLYRNGTLVYNGTGVCSMGKLGKAQCIYKDKSLTPNTLYNYTVTATTGGGSTTSPTSTVRTPESSPKGIPLPRLTPRSASEIYVEWDAPSNPNGIIIMYGVRVDGVQHNTSLSKSKVVSGLQPYTRYAFQVVACTAQGCGIGDRVYARTREAPPTGQGKPRLVAQEWNVVSISWDPPSAPNGIITTYQIYRKRGNDAPIVVCLKNSQTGLTRSCLDSGGNLKGYTQYKYHVRAINSAGHYDGQEEVVRTMEGPPRGIKQPIVFVINSTAVTASWEAPLEPNGIVTHYELRYQPLQAANINISVAGRVASNVLNMTVNILKPNTNYQFLVAAINRRREGVSSWTLAKTKEAPPADLKPLRADRKPGGTSLRLYWEEPGSPNGRITHYNLYKDGIQLFRGSAREYTVTRLIPYTAYEFQLEACTAAGCTRGQLQTIYSAEVNPSGLAPSSSAFVNATVVVITWRPPAVPNGVIERYDIIRRSTPLQRRKRRAIGDNIVYSTNKTNATQFQYMDKGLSPHTLYEYKVRAVNKGGQADSDWLRVETKEAAPGSVSLPRVIQVDAYRLNVTWIKPSQPNGIIQYYLVYRNGTIIHKGEQLSFVDEGRDPYTVYSYTVTACTGGGCTESGPAHQQTAEAAPALVHPPSLTALSPLAISIKWQTPGKPNGVITRFLVFEGSSSSELYSGIDKTFTVSGRTPYTKYTFAISACTKAGCTKGGPASVRTLEAPPGVMAAPVATVAGSSVVRVQWSPPAQLNGVLLYYVLTRSGVMVYNGSDVRFDDYTVAPYKVYAYRVKAVNKAGPGPESPPGNNPPTYPGAPDNVSTPVVSVLSSTSIQATWTEPGRPNGVIKKYVIIYNGKEKEAGLSKTITLDGLQPYTWYDVKVKACTTDVACSTGEAARARTLEASPQQQGRPVFPSEHIAARRVLVTWTVPVKPNGFIRAYGVERREVNRPIGQSVSYGPALSVYNTTNGTVLAFTDTTVKPYAEYEYRVTSMNNAGTATSGWAVVRTQPAVPENVPAPQITKTHQNRLEVLLRSPSTPNGVIRKYTLEVSGRNTSTGLEMSRVVSGLDPYTVYHVRVFVCTDAGCTASPSITARTAEGTPSLFGAPRVVRLMSRAVELAWNEPGKPNGVLKGYEVLRRLSCSRGCEVPVNGTLVSLNRNHNVTGLLPYVAYDFIIRVYNNKYNGLSDVKAAVTLPEDPVATGIAPRVNVTGYNVAVDWSKCFILNGPLDVYVLKENGVVAYTGKRLANDRPNRPQGEYTYEIEASTIVNGEKKTVKAPAITVTVPKGETLVKPKPGARAVPVYSRVWFIAVMVLVTMLLLFVLLALCLKRRSGDRTVYVREREPLPPRTKMRSRPPSMSSLYTSSDRKAGSVIDMQHMNGPYQGSTVALFDSSERLKDPDQYDVYDRYDRYDRTLDLTDGSVHKFGLEGNWDGFQRTYSNKDSGLFTDDKLPLSDSDDDSTPHHSFKREQYFTDTHL